jgi:phosphatidylglycerophosphatase A
VNIREFLYTGFYSGYSPVAPGTAGTLVAMAIYILINFLFEGIDPEIFQLGYFVFVMAAIFPSVRLGDYAEKNCKVKDPQHVVIDEIIGYWISLLFVPFSISAALLAFVLFRIFDIVKPFPANQLQSLSGGLGIVIDDVIAGFYACVLMHIAVYFFDYYNILLP